MGKVEYELPNNLGTLILPVPEYWVGGRGESVEALWIDQNGAVVDDIHVAGYHFGFPNSGKFIKDGNGYVFSADEA